MKVNLVLQPGQFSSFTSWYLEPLWREYFDIGVYDAAKTYSKETLFVFWWMNTGDSIVNELQNRGYKIVIDNLWELPNSKFDKFYQLNNPNWFWWNESLWWTALSYNNIAPEKTYKHLALMPIRRLSSTRDQIVKKMLPYLDQMLWSYKDHQLPNDDYGQRFVNPQWYNDTYFSVVVETQQHGSCQRLTEKTYKACAYHHPMLVVGQSNTLEFLKKQGFETFENIFNENYDQELDFEKRFNLIVDNLNHFVKEPYSDLTWKKLEHNHNHFFNKALCEQYIIKEIIEPLLHYAET